MATGGFANLSISHNLIQHNTIVLDMTSKVQRNDQRHSLSGSVMRTQHIYMLVFRTRPHALTVYVRSGAHTNDYDHTLQNARTILAI